MVTRISISPFLFQSTLPRGERQSYLEEWPECPCFNPRSRAGSDFHNMRHGFDYLGFNPRSRAGSDFCDEEDGPLSSVSIHAPARGATQTCSHPDNHRNVSIHAPARGATGRQMNKLAVVTGFNPRSRAGSDLGNTNKDSQFLVSITLPRGERPGTDVSLTSDFVSIHAPARGATSRVS